VASGLKNTIKAGQQDASQKIFLGNLRRGYLLRMVVKRKAFSYKKSKGGVGNA
jgi:hypothetical protein